MTRQRAMLVILAVLMLIVVLFKGRQAGDKPGLTAFVVEPSSASASMQLDGMVKYPGIYETIDNILTVSAINMAVPLCPEIVRTAVESRPIQIEDGVLITINCKPLYARDVITVQPIAAASAMVLGMPFSLNRATAEELDLLPGVGPVLAERIIEYRQKNGDFARVEDLLKIEGVGEKRLAEVKKYIK